MMCYDCGKKEAFAKGLCQTCYARDRRKNGKKPCSVGGCGNPAVSKGLCSKHAQHAAAQARARKIADLPGERWKNIDEHPKWMVSTMGRVKSLRGCNERLITPRVENGRLFIEDGTCKKSFAVHLQVLKTYRPDVTGDPIFIDGNPLNPSLANLKLDTRAEKIQRAIAMAEGSPSKWADDFAAYWRGDNRALDTFFIEMRKYLLKAVSKRLSTFWGFFCLDIDEIVHETIVKFFFSIHSATIKCLDGLHGYLLTISDNILRRHWRYSRPLMPINPANEEGLTNIDIAGYHHPSAEMVAMYNESKC